MAVENEPIPGSPAWMEARGLVQRPDGSWKPRSEIEEEERWNRVQKARGPWRSRK